MGQFRTGESQRLSLVAILNIYVCTNKKLASKQASKRNKQQTQNIIQLCCQVTNEQGMRYCTKHTHTRTHTHKAYDVFRRYFCWN